MQFFSRLTRAAKALLLVAALYAVPAHAVQTNLASSYSNRVAQADVALTGLTTTSVVLNSADATRFVLFNAEVSNQNSVTAQITLKVTRDSTESVSSVIDVAPGTHTIQLPYAFAGISVASHTWTATIRQNLSGPIVFTTNTYLGVFSPSEAGVNFSVGQFNTDPTDCGTDEFANTIDQAGNLGCSSIPNSATTATSSTVGSTIVARDSSGNFSANAITAGTFTGALTGNASTATALAANGANCSANNAPLGVDASGAAESCFAVVPQTRTISTTAPVTGGGDLSANRTIAVSTFVAAGASHASGIVPDPGATANTPQKWLREDATWGNALSFTGGGNTAGFSTAATNFFAISGPTRASATESDSQQPMPYAGTVLGLACGMPAAGPGAGKSFAFTVRKNGADTTMTCTISGTGQSCSDSAAHAFTFAVGDYLGFKVVPSGTPTASSTSCSITLGG